MTTTPETPGAGAAGQRLAALTDFAKALAAARWSDDALLIVAMQAMGALEADAVSLSVWERESGWLRTLVNVGSLAPHQEDRPTTELYPISAHPAIWEAFESGSGYVITLPAEGQAPDAAQRMLVERGKTSALSVPVVVDGRLWGELYASRGPQRPSFDAADLDFAAAVAVQVAAGVGQAEHLARVERLAFTDPLTGLANRRLLDDHLVAAMSRHRATGIPVTAVIIDVNNLKRINDERGHEAGDIALRALGHQLSATVANLPGALAVRLGGDEFCVLAVGVPAAAVVAAMDRFTVAARGSLADGVSVGIAATEYLADRMESSSALLRVADTAQYRAKRTRSRTPVVAGRPTVRASSSAGPTTAEATEPAPGRRRWRDPDLGAERLLTVAVEVLDGLGNADVQRRLSALAAEMCRLVDGSSWWLSMLPDGGDRFVTVDSGVARVPESPESGAFYEEATYRSADFPASLLAVDGGALVVSPDDPDLDPGELALLARGGFTDAVLAGGRDRSGDGWLVEIFADEQSVPPKVYALALRAAVAMALVEPARN